MSAPLPLRPRVPPALARRLDRLAFQAHAFHRWAHHPLCREYQGEVFRLGRKFRLCRGCTLAGAGMFLGLGGGLLMPILAPTALLGAGIVGLGTWPLVLFRRRFPKVLTRALPASLPPVFLLQALRTGRGLAWGLAALACIAAVSLVAAYRRRGPDRSACASCPEARLAGTCRGYREIRARERAYVRLASRWLGRESGTMGA